MFSGIEIPAFEVLDGWQYVDGKPTVCVVSEDGSLSFSLAAGPRRIGRAYRRHMASLVFRTLGSNVTPIPMKVLTAAAVPLAASLAS